MSVNPLNKKKITPTIIAFLVAIFASDLMLQGSGFYPNPTALDIASFCALFFLLSASKKAFYFLLFPVAILYALYSPIGPTFGAPSYQYFASVFATDLNESKEFLAQLPWLDVVKALLIVVLVLFFRLYSKKHHLVFHRNPLLVVLSALTLLINQAPFKFLSESYTAGMKVKTELDRLNNYDIKSQWGNSHLENSKYDDYILVIGESARRDYHHAYGYPVENTPFMDQSNGTLIDGFTSGGTNTIASLRLMLTKPDTQNWDSNYGLNLIDLIKSAGLKTYWISNQGYLGEFDTPISAIANKSDERIFLKSGDSLNSNTSDFALLPKFEQVISQPAQGKRFIVVHLYGSHPISCDRLTDYPKIFDDSIVPKRYFNVNCYISTIKKTDEVLKRLYQDLRENEQKNQRSFSMIYFSDHGLAHQMTAESINIHNSSGKSKRHFNIPLFKVSSDDTQRNVYKVFKSGLNFTDGIAQWIGIQNPQLNSQANLFSNQNDPTDYGLQQMIDKIEAPDDPAVIIPLNSHSEAK